MNEGGSGRSPSKLSPPRMVTLGARGTKYLKEKLSGIPQKELAAESLVITGRKGKPWGRSLFIIKWNSLSYIGEKKKVALALCLNSITGSLCL